MTLSPTQVKGWLTSAAPTWVWLVIAVVTAIGLAANVPDRLDAMEQAVEELQDGNEEDSRRLKKVECLVEALVLEEDPYARGCWRL